MYDIVYFVKDTKVNEELKYSLRSLVNFPYRKVWFYGGKPDDLYPDEYIKVDQDQPTKWQNIFKMYKLVCENDDITANFWLFNDDFFVMKKVKNPCNYYDGDLYKRVVTLEDTHNDITPYSQQLRYTLQELEGMGCPTLNYALHTPMLMNRKKGLEILNIIESPMIRCAYGNYFRVGGKQHKDVKIDSLTLTYKDGNYLSTNDISFNYGEVGKQIRAKFNKKSKYEI